MISHCGTSADMEVTDLVFANGIILIMALLKVLMMALKVVHKVVRPLGLKVSSAKTKLELFGDLLYDTIHPVHAWGEDTTKIFT